MGQTQLLMIVLAVIIVGIAVAVGIGQFGESALAANRDAVAADCQTIISKSQGWYRKPTSLGGGGNSFEGLTLAQIGVSASNENGSYAIAVSGDANEIVTCTGTGNENTDAGDAVEVTVAYNASDNTTTYSDNMEAAEE
jgi:hypothetical protein